MEEETAISPKPFRATIADVIRSGTEVPAAKMVKPMSDSSILIVSEMVCASQVMKVEKMKTKKRKMNHDRGGHQYRIDFMHNRLEFSF